MVGCYIWYSEEGLGRAAARPGALLAVPNVTAHPSTANVPITALLYNGPLCAVLIIIIIITSRSKFLVDRLGKYESMNVTCMFV